MRVIYLDNAATSWPKPEGTLRAVEHSIVEAGANPGRSGHRMAVEAARIIYDTRESLARLFGAKDPLRIVFTKNVTEALNLVFYGLLRPGDHVVTSSMEHNSVMRPLRHLEQRGVELTVVKASSSGEVDPEDFRRALKGNTRLVVLMHVSNVTGTVMPVEAVGQIARERGIPFCVDAAQSAGTLPIDLSRAPIDLLAFTGHKSLFGPQGTGGLYIGEGLEKGLQPITRGGTGSRSEAEEQPGFLPDKYESGTPNTPGIAGLGGGVKFLLSEGMERVKAKKERLTQLLLDGLREVPRVILYGPRNPKRQVAIVSFNIEGLSPSEVSARLDEDFGILTRPGLHCAPSAHRTIGTFPHGTVRMSLGYFNTEGEIERAIEALWQIAKGRS